MNFGQRGNQKIIKYNPLPSYLTIANSDLNGLGLFATKDIPKGTNLGVAHILIPHSEELFSQSYCRTPLGGFYNHSEDPNCEIKTRIHYFMSSSDYKRLVTSILELFTKKDIKEGEELTSNYILYKIIEKNTKVYSSDVDNIE